MYSLHTKEMYLLFLFILAPIKTLVPLFISFFLNFRVYNQKTGVKMRYVKSDLIKIKILKELKKSKQALSYYALMKNTKLKEHSFFRNFHFLKDLKFVSVKEIKLPNKRTYFYVTITKQGKEFLNNIKT
jgi:hypothetical protein